MVYIMKNFILSFLSLAITLSMLAGCATPIEPNLSATDRVSATTAPTEAVTTPSVTTPPTTPAPDVPDVPETPRLDVDLLISGLSNTLAGTDAPDWIASDFLYWLCENFGENLLVSLDQALADGYSNDLWYTLTGNTLNVLSDLYTGAVETDGRILYLSAGKPGVENQTTTMVFGGDICFADNYLTMEYMAKHDLTLTDCIDAKLIDEMKSADIAFMNNEFTISDRGKPMSGKKYTFRAAVANTALYHTLGIDLVSLANNHAYDYGKDAFLDTLDALAAENIASIGGGKNLDEAMEPLYYIVNGRKIAYVAATRAEKYKMTPEATETEPGVLRCYDTALFLEVIREAEANSDFVVACIHWGGEYEDDPQKVQLDTARDYIDAGVDLIIGAHAHQLQGVEFYKGKAIFYNLGNFWFNAYTIDTGLAKVELLPDGSTVSTFIPALQKNCITSYQGDTEKGQSILRWMEAHSINARFDEDGLVSEKAE